MSCRYSNVWRHHFVIDNTVRYLFASCELHASFGVMRRKPTDVITRTLFLSRLISIPGHKLFSWHCYDGACGLEIQLKTWTEIRTYKGVSLVIFGYDHECLVSTIANDGIDTNCQQTQTAKQFVLLCISILVQLSWNWNPAYWVLCNHSLYIRCVSDAWYLNKQFSKCIPLNDNQL